MVEQRGGNFRLGKHLLRVCAKLAKNAGVMDERLDAHETLADTAERSGYLGCVRVMTTHAQNPD